MTQSKYSYEMPASDFAASTPDNRAVVLDAEVLWGGAEVRWSAENIQRVLSSWCDFDSPYQYGWPIVVIDRHNTRAAWQTEEAASAWHTVARHLSYEIPTELQLLFWGLYGPCGKADFVAGDESRRSFTVQVLTKDTFDLIEQHFLNEVDVLINEARILDYLDLDFYHDTESLDDALSQGHISVLTDMLEDGKHGVKEVILLSLNDSAQVSARGFWIPRIYDPSGHLP